MKEADTDLDLLREFVEMGSDAAFAELVKRHIDLIYSVALRQLRGDAHLAGDAAQAVFCELARNARKLTGYRTLSGWLYTTTRFVASRMKRSELRRMAREEVFAMKESEPSDGEADWREVEALLDDAMQDLSAEDREAVLLRYFKNESFGAIGAVLGASENAARMRVERALEKLRVALNRRGVTCPSAVLSGLLMANAISSAPAGLAAAIAMPALASAAAANAFTHSVGFLPFMATTKIKAAAVIIALAGTTTGWITAQRNLAQREREIVQLRQAQTGGAQDLRAGGEPAEKVELERLREERNELMRLRAEVTQLRRRAFETPAAGRPDGKSATRERAPGEEVNMQTLGIAKLNVAKRWSKAFFQFAQTNNGRMPTDFHEVERAYAELPTDEPVVAEPPDMLNGAGFEITFQGRLEDVENPAQAIIMREKEPFHAEEDGAAYRTYLFADGHSEIHRARDGNFERWEEQRRPRLRRDVTRAE